MQSSLAQRALQSDPVAQPLAHQQETPGLEPPQEPQSQYSPEHEHDTLPLYHPQDCEAPHDVVTIGGSSSIWAYATASDQATNM